MLIESVGQKFELASGKLCHLTPIRNDLIPNYYLLAFPKDQGQPSAAEVTEMLNFGFTLCFWAIAGERLGCTLSWPEKI
jgi:hypothetical protein